MVTVTVCAAKTPAAADTELVVADTAYSPHYLPSYGHDSYGGKHAESYGDHGHGGYGELQFSY